MIKKYSTQVAGGGIFRKQTVQCMTIYMPDEQPGSQVGEHCADPTDQDRLEHRHVGTTGHYTKINRLFLYININIYKSIIIIYGKNIPEIEKKKN